MSACQCHSNNKTCTHHIRTANHALTVHATKSRNAMSSKQCTTASIVSKQNSHTHTQSDQEKDITTQVPLRYKDALQKNDCNHSNIHTFTIKPPHKTVTKYVYQSSNPQSYADLESDSPTVAHTKQPTQLTKPPATTTGEQNSATAPHKTETKQQKQPKQKH